MKLKKLIPSLLAICLTASAAATTNKTQTQKQPVPYDADLFRRDEPVFAFHGSFLYWRVQESTNDYALKQQYTATDAINTYGMGKYHNATFDGEPGFRIAASYFRAPHYWEIWGQYTRLSASGHNTTYPSGKSGEYLVGTWSMPTYQDSPTALKEASTHLHMNYNTADLLTDRFFNPNPHLRIRLLGGGTMAWMNHNFDITYVNTVNETSQIKNFWKFIGGGLKIGTMIDWFCGWDIYLTTTFTGSTLLGTYKNKVKQTFSGQSEPVGYAKYADVRPTFCFQTIFGPSWQKNFTSSRLEIFAGYEMNAWFNLSETYRSSSGSAQEFKVTNVNSSMLALQGLTFRTSIDF